MHCVWLLLGLTINEEMIIISDRKQFVYRKSASKCLTRIIFTFRCSRNIFFLDKNIHWVYRRSFFIFRLGLEAFVEFIGRLKFSLSHLPTENHKSFQNYHRSDWKLLSVKFKFNLVRMSPPARTPNLNVGSRKIFI